MNEGKSLYYLIYFFLSLFLVNNSFAAIPFETPYYSIGSEFILADGYGSFYDAQKIEYPRVECLFDNTHIYLDNNNDGVYDYSFYGNEKTEILIDPLIETPKFGAKLRADKPVIYYQKGYSLNRNNFGYDTYFNYLFSVPPINSFRKEYIVIGPNIGTWNVLTDKNITLFVQSNKLENFSVNRAEKKSLVFSNYAKVYSDDYFGLVSYSGPAAIKGKIFFAPYNKLKIIVLENETYLEIDYNNDGFYDNKSNYYNGVYSFDVIEGSKIRANKDVAVYADLDGVYFAASPANTIGSDLFAKTSYGIGLFSEATGFSNETKADIYKSNEEYNDTFFVKPNQRLNYLFSDVRINSDMPLLSLFANQYKIQQTYSSTNSRSISVYPYSKIYLTYYSDKKYVSNNQVNKFVVRIFNPFIEETAIDFTVFIDYPKNFTSLSGIVIEKKDLNTDTVLNSINADYLPTQEGFYVNELLNPILGDLGPMQYFEITFDIISPDYLDIFKGFSAKMTYSADTWVLT